VLSFSLKVLSKSNSLVSTYLVMPSTLNLLAKILILGLATETQSISPFKTSFLKIILFLTQTHNLRLIAGLWAERRDF